MALSPSPGSSCFFAPRALALLLSSFTCIACIKAAPAEVASRPVSRVQKCPIAACCPGAPTETELRKTDARAQELIESSQQAQRKGKFSQAERAAEQALALIEASKGVRGESKARLALAKAQLALDSFPAAETNLKLALSLETKAERGQCRIYEELGLTLGRLYLEADAAAFAIEWLEPWAQQAQGKRKLEVLLLLAKAELLAGDSGAALRIYQQAEKLALAEAQNLKENALEEKDSLVLVAIEAALGAAKLELAAHRLQRVGQALTRIENLEAQIQIKSNPAYLLIRADRLLLSARLKGAEGKLDAAIKDYEQGVVLEEKVLAPGHPRLGLSYYNIGTLYARKGEPLLAIKYLRLALESQSQGNGRATSATVRSLTNLATAYSAAGNLSLALDYYREALRGAESLGVESKDLASRIAHTLTQFCEEHDCAAKPEQVPVSADGY